MNSLRTLSKLIPGCATLFLLMLSGNVCFAVDLEVIESFWTTSQPPADSPVLKYPKLEVDRSDGRAFFAVTFVNRGQNDIASIRGTTSLPSGVKHSTSNNSVAKSSHLAAVRAGEAFTLLFPVEFGSNFDSRNYRLSVVVEYSQVQSKNKFSESHETDFRLTGRTNLDVQPQGALEPGMARPIVIKVTNRGTAKATGVRLTLPSTSGSNPSSPQAQISILGPRLLEATTIEPGQTIDLSTTIFASSSTAGSIQRFEAAISYRNACLQPIESLVGIGISVFPNQHQGYLDFRPDLDLSKVQAGQLSDLKFNFVNQSTQTLTDLSVTVTPSDSSAMSTEPHKIMGQQRWLQSSMEPKRDLPILLSVFASREQIGRATSIQFLAQYKVDGHPHTQSFAQSIYVDGQISIQLRDVAITMIGDVPNLTGSLLNEGAGTAQFSSMEIVECEGCNKTSTRALYLGDIAENSPLPFSIPLDMENETSVGRYKIRLRLDYKNLLKEKQAIELSADALYTPEAKSAANDAEPGPQPKLPAYLGWLAGGMAIGFIGAQLFRKNRNPELLRVIQQSKLEGMNRPEETVDTSSTRASP